MSPKSAVKLTYKPVPVAPLPASVGTAAPKTVDDAAEALGKKLPGSVKSVEKAHKGDPFLVIEPGQIVDVVRFLRDDERFACTNLSVISAVDYLPKSAAEGTPEVPGRIEVVYVLFSYVHRFQIVLKVQLSRENPKVASLVDLYRCANWYERECYDMIGVEFQGHPHLARILLPPDWVGYPLRKDYVFPEEYNGMKVPL